MLSFEGRTHISCLESSPHLLLHSHFITTFSFALKRGVQLSEGAFAGACRPDEGRNLSLGTHLTIQKDQVRAALLNFLTLHGWGKGYKTLSGYEKESSTVDNHWNSRPKSFSNRAFIEIVFKTSNMQTGHSVVSRESPGGIVRCLWWIFGVKFFGGQKLLNFLDWFFDESRGLWNPFEALQNAILYSFLLHIKLHIECVRNAIVFTLAAKVVNISLPDTDFFKFTQIVLSELLFDRINHWWVLFLFNLRGLNHSFCLNFTLCWCLTWYLFLLNLLRFFHHGYLVLDEFFFGTSCRFLFQLLFLILAFRLFFTFLFLDWLKIARTFLLHWQGCRCRSLLRSFLLWHYRLALLHSLRFLLLFLFLLLHYNLCLWRNSL